VDTEDGELYLANGQYRRESFLEFMRRPTGFGANSWAQIAFIAVILLFGVAVIIGTWTDHGWVALPVPVGVVVVLFLKSYHQYLGRTR
jgi:fatty acid desaturase